MYVPCILCGLLCAQYYLVADCCCVVSLAGEAKAFLFEQYFTQRLLADHRRYKSKELNSNTGGVRLRRRMGEGSPGGTETDRSPDDIVDVVVDILGLQRDHGLGLLESYSGRLAEK